MSIQTIILSIISVFFLLVLLLVLVTTEYVTRHSINDKKLAERALFVCRCAVISAYALPNLSHSTACSVIVSGILYWILMDSLYIWFVRKENPSQKEMRRYFWLMVSTTALFAVAIITLLVIS